VPYSDPESRRAAQRDSARRRRSAAASPPSTARVFSLDDVASMTAIGDAAPVLVAGRQLSLANADGVLVTVEPGEPVDVSGWSPRRIEVSVSVGELVPPSAPGRSRFVATTRLRLADGTWAEPGDPVPDSTWRSARGSLCYERLGQIRPNPLASTPM
jgi:hypothetical protein